jgi:small-conductance mechanosensitive channel
VSRRHVVSLAALLLVCTALLDPGVVRAQAVAATSPEPAPASAAGSAPATVAPIDAARIPAEAARADAVARDAVDRFGVTTTQPRLERHAARLAAALTAFERSPAVAALDSLSISRLETLQRQAELYVGQAKSLEDTANARASDLSEAAAALARLQTQWLATRDVPSLPAPLRERADATLRVLDEASGALAAPLAAALDAEAETASLAPRAKRAERRVARALARADERLLRVDVPPLWRSADLSSTGERLGLRSLEDDRRLILEYADATAGRKLAWNVVSLALLAALLWLRHRERRVVTVYSGAPSEAAALLQRPWSAWLLIVLIGVRLLSPNAPALAVEIVLAATIVPLLRVAPVLLKSGPVAGLYGVAALFVLDRLRYLAQDGVGFRYALLIAATAGAVILAWLAWRLRAGSALQGRWRSMAFAGCVLGAGLLALAAVANVVGNVTLADVLTRGTALGAYRAALLVAGVAVAVGVAALLLETPAARHLRIVANHRDRLLAFTKHGLALVAVAAWTYTTLQGFRLWQPIADAVSAALSEPVRIGDLSISAGDVGLFFLCLYVSYKLAQFVRFLLREEVLNRSRWPLGVRSTVQTLSFYALVAIGFLVALTASGVELGRFAILAGALGVGVGLGLQGIVTNFVSGLILMFERPIQPGDVVEIDGAEGTVKAIGLRATTLGTAAGSEIVVPNGTLLQGKLVNWAREPARRVEVTVQVAHGSNPALVTRILADAASRHPDCAARPAPAVLLDAVDTVSMRFVVLFHTVEAARWRAVRSAVLIDAVTSLRAEGVDIAPPSDLRITGPGVPLVPTTPVIPVTPAAPVVAVTSAPAGVGPPHAPR